MALNFNVDPYYDDFSNDKNFHRILFKPGYAVQARELTQAQTILQDQITKFADHVFKQNSPVTGGNVTSNLNCFYVKLQQTYSGSTISVNDFLGKTITDSAGLIVANVLAVAEPTGGIDINGNYLGDPPTLILSYRSGDQFQDNDIIYDTASNLACQAIVLDATGDSSVSSIDVGVFYVLGNFVQIPTKQTTILSKYSNTPSVRVGLTIDETIADYVNDPSLLDPALGASNYQAPGADRYQITLTLSTRPLQFGDDQDFIELVRFENGNMFKMVDGSVYSTIDDYFAKRTYETNGDYTVTDFKLTPKVNSDNSDTYIMNVGKGIAYVKGYRIENPTPIDVITNRARTIASQNNTPIYTDYGSYFYVNNVVGENGYTFDITTTDAVELHCVGRASISNTTANTYNSTLVGTAYIRGLQYDNDAGSANTKNWIYKMYVNDIQTNSLSGILQSSSSNSSIVILPNTTAYSTVNEAYTGMVVQLTDGTNAGESRVITSYNGSSKTATVSPAWSIATDATTKFSLLFDITNIESIVKVDKSSYPATIKSSATISLSGKVNGLTSGDTILENPLTPELIFPIGYPYVSHISGTGYETYKEFRGINFTGSGTVTATLSLTDYNSSIKHLGQPSSTLSSDAVKQNYIITVTNKGSNTTMNVGDIIPWTTSSSISISSTGLIATLSSTQYSAFTADIVSKVYVSNADDSSYVLKIKNLVTANSNTVFTSGTQVNTYTFVDDSTYSTGQVYIQNAGIVVAGQNQSLYLSDVKNIVKIIDTKSSATVPTIEMLTSSANDITNNYYFDNGQRDNYYDHASLKLKPGAPNPTGNLLILLNYYKHTGGDGYFSKLSYVDESLSPEEYRQIPSYRSKYGSVYSLRDCLDFRPARLNAQSSFVYRYSNPSDTIKYGTLLPIDLSIFTCNLYSYYLSRKDKLLINRDREISILEGIPSLNPILPTEPEGSLVLANLTHKPYTGYIPTEISGLNSDLSIEHVQHRRYTMQDISELDTRIGRIEYYTSLNILEKNAAGLQIQDAYGLNRFKNGILVDDFSSFETSDTSNLDFVCNINKRLRELSAIQGVNNYPLTNLLMAYNMGNPSSSVLNSLSYSVRKDNEVSNYLLPYTQKEIAKQVLASRYINVNPFAVTTAKGIAGLSPNVDNWVDTNYDPSILITAPGLQIFSNTLLDNIPINLLSTTDWQTISSTKTLESKKTTSGVIDENLDSNGGFSITTRNTTTSVYNNTIIQQRNFKYGPYSSIKNTYSMNNGFVTDVSVLPYLRKQEISISVNEMLLNAKVYNFFDNVNVDGYIKKPNTIELTGVTGTISYNTQGVLTVGEFRVGDIIGYKTSSTSSTFTATGKVVGIYYYPNGSSIRLYVSSDAPQTSYNNGYPLYNAFFGSNNTYTNSTAYGTVQSYTHNSGLIDSTAIRVLIYPPPVYTTNTIKLAPMASSVDGSYVGQTLFINTGKGAGQYASITAYTGSTRTATLSKNVSYSIYDAYTLGTTTLGDTPFRTNEAGSMYGIFYVPENTFQNGQRTYRIDNRINNNTATATTYAEATFYATGLQATKQRLDFGASPASYEVKENRTNNWKTVDVQTTDTTQYFPPPGPDPVAQTFIIDSQNYPNGAFLSSIRVFFKSKTTDSTPVSLRIVGTLNGYPNGDILPHSYVSVKPTDVKVSESPQYLDSTTYTTFEFSVPVFIKPDVLYAFIVRSDNNQYEVWTALNSDPAIPSSVKNLPTDPTPSNITKITAAPYVGALFMSQNSQTWTADQNQSMMFVINRCVFDTTKTPIIRFVTPKGLPQRKIVEQSIDYFGDANNISSTVSNASVQDMLYDAFNLTTTDLIPSRTDIKYSYSTTLKDGTSEPVYSVDPGKYGTTMYNHVYLNDNLGERILQANSTTSFSMYAQLSSTNDAVSPVISEAGTSLYTIRFGINNCELSNTNINVTNRGSGYYNANSISVTVESPTGKYGEQAYAKANVNTASGLINSVYITYPGSGYVTTPTITITDANTTPGTGATAVISGETSSNGGPAYVKYFTKKVVLDQGFDSGDLNVYLTAYRPINTDILVYYKLLSRSDNQKFEDGKWQLMTKIKNSETLYSYDRDEQYEFIFAPGVQDSNAAQGYVSYESSTGKIFNDFNQFAIKIVLTSIDKTFVPYVSDLRCIALPNNN